ncbi:uncharacterized protein DEA37_0004924 [Paragonimus westermani]|uniref:Uncharacterized protein n=1 Tax=Paragonimus westermani TaxID=34504 RepID=A0A5J4P101_9TREM|nr:uncharacterized protein DEA37_0004924 [Paragonimus westermani]
MSTSEQPVFVFQSIWWALLTRRQKIKLVVYCIACVSGTVANCFAIGYDEFHTARLRLIAVQNQQDGIVYRQLVYYNVTVIERSGIWTKKPQFDLASGDERNTKETVNFLQQHAEIGLRLWRTCAHSSLHGPTFYYLTLVLFIFGLSLLLYSLPLIVISREAMIIMSMCGGLCCAGGQLFQNATANAIAVCVFSTQSGRYRGIEVRRFWNDRYFEVDLEFSQLSSWICLASSTFCFLPMIVLGLLLVVFDRKNL